MTADSIAALTRRALDRGLGVATHAIGDDASARALDAYAAVLAERTGLDRSRLRIEHFSYASEADLARAVPLGVVLSVQSDFNSAVGEEPSFGAIRVGAANEARVYPWDRLYRAGAVLVEGTDYFAKPGRAMDPFLATLTRKYAVGTERPDREARVLAWRLNASHVPPTGRGRDGVLRVGGPADLVLLDGNPFAGPRAGIDSVRVAGTLRDGRLTFGSGPLRDAFGARH